MSTRKSIASKKSSAPRSKNRNRPARSSTAAAHLVSAAVGRIWGSGSRQFNFANVAKYVTPGAAAVASGALGAAGFAFKEQIGEILIDVIKATTARGVRAAVTGSKVVDSTREQAMDAVETFSDKVSLQSILEYAGLQRRSTLRSIVGPAIGVACGVLAGSALTYFFGPKLLDQLRSTNTPANDATVENDSSIEETGTTARTPSASREGFRPLSSGVTGANS